jgi:hypothetical protein
MNFPVEHGIHGMNTLAICLNASGLAGEWHFGSGSRFDQSPVRIDFDDPADAVSAWRHYCDSEVGGPAMAG